MATHDDPVVTVPKGGKVRLRINSRSGSVLVIAEERRDIAVERGADATSIRTDDTGQVTLDVAPGAGGVDVRCPLDTDVIVGGISGRVSIRGAAGSVTVGTVSGNIDVEQSATADLRSTSGSIAVGACQGRCRVNTKSGKATIGASGAAELCTVSGTVSIAKAGGPVLIKTVSGDVDLHCAGPNDVAVHTISGGIVVRLPAGVHPAAHIRSLRGHPRFDLAQGHDCDLVIRTLSGKIDVVAG